MTMDAINRLFNAPVDPAMANAILAALLALAAFALIGYLRRLSAEERRRFLKILRTILLFPLVVFWVVITSQSHCCNCQRCNWHD
jgi:dipeptide/tripeptide permease